MPIYKSFKDFAIQQLANFANATDANKVLRQSVVEIFPVVLQRIQNEGKNSANTQMHTKSAEAYGAYSKAYGKYRQKKGRQTAIIDLTFNGDMIRSFKPGPSGPHGYGLGFLNAAQADIAAYNEENFGVIFNVTPSELTASLASINKQAQKLLSK